MIYDILGIYEIFEINSIYLRQYTFIDEIIFVAKLINKKTFGLLKNQISKPILIIQNILETV